MGKSRIINMNQYCLVDGHLNVVDVYNRRQLSIYREFNKWKMITNFHDFKRYLMSSDRLPGIISFGHNFHHTHRLLLDEDNFATIGIHTRDIVDLQYSTLEHKTGYCFAKFLVEFCLENYYPLPMCFAHSTDERANTNILGALDLFHIRHLEVEAELESRNKKGVDNPFDLSGQMNMLQ